MAFGLPAFFGSKAATRVPLGVDVTSITDISGSMGGYVNFVTSPLLYEALEAALRAEGVGVAAGETNRYSFCIGGYDAFYKITLSDIEKFCFVNGGSQRWAPGADVLAKAVSYPTYYVGGGGYENISGATNVVSVYNTSDSGGTYQNPRNYILDNERIIIAGSDEQSGQRNVQFQQSVPYSYRYVGIHSAGLKIYENSTLPPKPAGTLVGFVYTTASQGVAIYLDNDSNPAVINYRTEMPTIVFEATPNIGDQTQICLDQCRITNGAVYNIRAFTQAAQYALLGESLGSVLGKYLYSVS